MLGIVDNLINFVGVSNSVYDLRLRVMTKTATRVYNMLGNVIVETATERFSIESINSGSEGTTYMRDSSGKVVKSQTYSNLLTSEFKKDDAVRFMIDLVEMIEIGKEL